MRTLSDRLSWLCGFIDGEAHIGIWKTKRKNTTAFVSGITIAGTHKYSIELCALIYNTLIVPAKPVKCSSYKSSNPNWKRVHSVRFSNQEDLLSFCKLIQPHIVVKCEQVTILITYLTNRIAHNKRVLSNSDNHYTKTDERLYKRMKKLNKKGGL